MRFLVVFLLVFGLNLGAKNIEEGLKFLEIPSAKKEILREAMIEFYKQRQKYHQGNAALEYEILAETAKEGYGNVNFLEYEKRIEAIHQSYIHAKIAFYRNIGQILDEREIFDLMEFMGED